MAECEVCGKSVEFSKRAEIDGVILEVCDKCAKLGKEVAPPRPVFIPRAARAPRPESIESERELANDFSARIRKAREKANLTQDEAAMKIGISHLVYKRIESGFKPDEAIARKIERFFGVSLYQQTH
jgi:putative transcription factor